MHAIRTQPLKLLSHYSSDFGERLACRKQNQGLIKGLFGLIVFSEVQGLIQEVLTRGSTGTAFGNDGYKRDERGYCWVSEGAERGMPFGRCTNGLRN